MNEQPTTTYVVGFLLGTTFDTVVLIRKARPLWHEDCEEPRNLATYTIEAERKRRSPDY
ncbi:hypothetical protein LCGC14_2086490 [marine sediment metagenome]|uniref:Uncharacterized protein n=1 Tax=marine sediment metagenome TaxID=412755 RepID=A0A0F9GSG0_9ZZZZ